MIAIFSKNRSSAETQNAALLAQGQSALNERMTRMLRQDARLAWASPRENLPFPGAVKKPISIRKTIAQAC